VQQILGCILLLKQKYVYLIEFAIQNIKLAFKLWDWLWFKNKTGRGGVRINITLRGVCVDGKSSGYYMLESVSVAMGMKNAVHMRRTVASFVTYLAVWYFSTLSHKWHSCQKICMEHKTCVLIFCTIFV
jgi:hypothetical protein